MLTFDMATSVTMVAMDAGEKTSSPPFWRNEKRKSAETMTTGTVSIDEKIGARLILRRTIASLMFTLTRLERANAR